MVNVVGGSHTGGHTAQVIDGSQNVVCNDMLGIPNKYIRTTRNDN